MKIVVLLLVLCLLAIPAYAQESGNDTGTVGENETDTVDESVVQSTPGEFWYGFQRFFENVDKFFTFDKSEKAKKHAYYGKKRAVEAHIMTKKAQQLAAQGNLEGANETMALVQQLLADQAAESEDAQEQLEAAINEGTATDEEVGEVETQLRNSIMVLQRVYEKAPEPAKDGLLRALNNSISNQERHEEKLQEKDMLKIQKKLHEEDQNQTQNQTGQGNGPGKIKPGKNQTETEDGPGAGKGKGKAKGGGTDDEEEDEEENETE